MCVEIEGDLLSQLNFGYVCHLFRANKIDNMYPIQHTVYTYWYMILYLSMDSCSVSFNKKFSRISPIVSGCKRYLIIVVFQRLFFKSSYLGKLLFRNMNSQSVGGIPLPNHYLWWPAGGLVALIWSKRNCSEINQACSRWWGNKFQILFLP